MDKDVIIQHCNDALARYEERILEAHGRGGWASEMAGTDFILSKNIKGKTVEEIIDKCIKEMTAAGMAKSITYSPSPLPKPDSRIEFKVSDCIHLPKESKLLKDGVTPFTCPIGNMLSTGILDIAKYEVGSFGGRETVIDEEKKECILRGWICENIDKAVAPPALPSK